MEVALVELLRGCSSINTLALFWIILSAFGLKIVSKEPKNR